MVFGIALHELGWRITYLGPDTPIEALTEISELIRPELTVVAAAMPQHVRPHVQPLCSFSHKWHLAMAGSGVSARLAKQAGARYLDEDPVSAARTVSL
jgi:methanogenic corrinoid protein MtbC1